MALVLRGKKAAHDVELLQWCNDWISVRASDGTEGIVKPTNLRLTPAEAKLVTENPCGLMFHWFELRDDGTFRDLRPKRRRRGSQS